MTKIRFFVSLDYTRDRAVSVLVLGDSQIELNSFEFSDYEIDELARYSKRVLKETLNELSQFFNNKYSLKAVDGFKDFQEMLDSFDIHLQRCQAGKFEKKFTDRETKIASEFLELIYKTALKEGLEALDVKKLFNKYMSRNLSKKKRRV